MALLHYVFQLASIYRASCTVQRPVSLFVAISPGLPRRQHNTHIREVAVHFSGLNTSLVTDGCLVLARDWEFRSILKRINIHDELEDDEDPTEGRIFTGYVIPPSNFSAQIVPTDCIGYFIRLEWRSTIIAESCLRVYPDWMGQLVDQEPAAVWFTFSGNLTLNYLAIPGSHNAGAYKVYEPHEESFITWYRDCQEEDIYSQLVYGSRFLDIRPGLVSTNNTKTFWVFHSAIRTDNRLQSVLHDVKKFLDEHKREVIFIDFHEFPWGFKTSADYTSLGDFVEKHLGPYILQYRPHMITLSETVALNQRAVVTFSQDDNLARRFLPGVYHAWANTDNLQVLKDRLRQMQNQQSEGNRLYSAMAQLTPQGALNIIFDQYQGGVRALSHLNNMKVMLWWRKNQEYRTSTNIIAMDYLTSSSVVDICRAINAQRALDLRRGHRLP
ncbi:uncharacterized protein LOC111248040 isoform X2 [Varroa destructor]|uniref:Uncharacterized protein n=1 Tax=Varroa destructor TaxID=109461 RepID=A0A7M7JQQ6_VARDE|nr:uncharacterized protein LOC111248040 isoform X2 [Varroa destructor]